jgi:hypothetical protein
MASTREPLGAGVTGLIVIDMVLVLAFGVLFVQGGHLDDVLGQPRTAAGLTTSATPTAEPVVFASPTRNIACRITPDGVRCEIAQFMYAKPTVEGCAGDVGHEVELTPDGAAWVCRTATTPPPTPSADIANLEWGESTAAYGYTCTSAHNGVICTNDETGKSFSLARREVSLS